jgi:ectoine hydroxylase-related dioxygenase (phytanoyl-CoA dioxygenase family)
MNCSFNKQPVKIKEIEYTKKEEAVDTLQKRGFCFLKNVIKINFDHTRYFDNSEVSVKKIVEFNTQTQEYSNISNDIYKSELMRILSGNNKSVYLSDIDLRCFKNHHGTFLHKDSDVFYDRVFDYDLVTCWTPLVNTTLETGTIAIVDRFIDVQQRSNAIKRKLSFINKRDTLNTHNKTVREISNGFKPNKEVYLRERDEWLTHGDEFYAKELKIGDVALFTKESLHGALDTNKGIRASLDFRLAIIPQDKAYILNYILNTINT